MNKLILLIALILFSCKTDIKYYCKVRLYLVNGKTKDVFYKIYEHDYFGIGCVNYDCGYSTITINGHPESQYNVVDFKIISKNKI